MDLRPKRRGTHCNILLILKSPFLSTDCCNLLFHFTHTPLSLPRNIVTGEREKTKPKSFSSSIAAVTFLKECVCLCVCVYTHLCFLHASVCVWRVYTHVCMQVCVCTRTQYVLGSGVCELTSMFHCTDQKLTPGVLLSCSPS